MTQRHERLWRRSVEMTAGYLEGYNQGSALTSVEWFAMAERLARRRIGGPTLVDYMLGKAQGIRDAERQVSS